MVITVFNMETDDENVALESILNNDVKRKDVRKRDFRELKNRSTVVAIH